MNVDKVSLKGSPFLLKTSDSKNKDIYDNCP